MPVTTPLSASHMPEKKVEDVISDEERLRQILEDEPDILPEDFPKVGAKALKLINAQVDGRVNLKPGQVTLLGSMFRHLIPSAGKMDKEASVIRPEVYIEEAMAGNSAAFIKLQKKAKEYGRQVETRSKEFYKELEAKI